MLTFEFSVEMKIFAHTQTHEIEPSNEWQARRKKKCARKQTFNYLFSIEFNRKYKHSYLFCLYYDTRHTRTHFVHDERPHVPDAAVAAAATLTKSNS